MALKRHFSSKYDFFKNHGKTRTSREAFAARHDRRYFEQLAKREDGWRLLLANMLHDHNQWIGNLFTEEGEKIYQTWQNRIAHLTYNFTSDLRKLNEPFNLNFSVDNALHPPLLTAYLSGEVSLETMVILEQLLGYCKKWDKQISEKYVWPEVSMKIKKYSPFLVFDQEKMRKKALDAIS